jgi:hypothetical protein
MSASTSSAISVSVGFGHRPDGCAGLAGRAEMMTDSEIANSRPVRKVVLRREGGPL